MQQLLLTGGGCDPRVEFLFCKSGLRVRIDLLQLPREPPSLEVVIIYRVSAERVRRAHQRSTSRAADDGRRDLNHVLSSLVSFAGPTGRYARRLPDHAGQG
jgi:hypothetical protein